jgi:EAL domain-containing protein (putative c-di-GMP-specific phosphodiesterase class I)
MFLRLRSPSRSAALTFHAAVVAEGVESEWAAQYLSDAGS